MEDWLLVNIVIAITLSDSSGNQTNCSAQTPPIFVPFNLDSTNVQSPWAALKTIGEDPQSGVNVT